MYKRMGVKKLGRTKSHRDSLIRNQIRTLFSSGALNSTTAKSKVIKSRAESLLSKVKKSEISLAERRSLVLELGNKELLGKVLEYAKKDKAGVRIVKTGFRAGDNAQVSRVELIDFKTKKSVKKVEKKDEIKEAPVKEVNKDIVNRTAKKTVSKKVGAVKQERVRTRSGL